MFQFKTFEGACLHSHDYRCREPFSGKTVAILGMGPSGFDIGLEVATRAREVVLCHNSEAWPAPLPANVSQRAGIVACSGEGDLLLADGSRLRAVDALVHCTGYNYSYPFLSRSCGLEFAGRQVRTLYKQLVNAARPTMALVGIPQMVLPFRLFDLQVGLRLACILNISHIFCLFPPQVRWFVLTLTGERPLPAPDQMRLEAEAESRRLFDVEGVPERRLHQLGSPKQWKYCDELARLAGEEVSRTV